MTFLAPNFALLGLKMKGRTICHMVKIPNWRITDGYCLDTKTTGRYLCYDSISNGSDSEIVSKVIKS
jgi:hypothetical protein